MSPINDLGYGIAGKNICRALNSIGYNISLFPIGDPNFSSQEEADYFNPLLKQSSKFDINAPCLKIWHEFGMAERIGKGRMLGFPFFEVNKFDDRRKHHLSSCDDVLVASKWAEKIISEQVPTANTHVVPLGVDTDLFKPPSYSGAEWLDAEGEKENTESLVFFNCGKWEKRKGHDLLLLLFQEAFKTEGDVELWMMCENPFLPPQESVKWTSVYASDPRVRLIPRVQAQNQMLPILRSVDCGIFPSRAEGWNLEILELMSMGKHIITTDYSAHTEYCTEDNSMLATPYKEEPAVDGIWFHGEAEWASLEGLEELFISYMRDVYSKWKDGTLVQNIDGIETAKKYTWTACANRIKEVLDED